jgi:hypothetical protein
MQPGPGRVPVRHLVGVVSSDANVPSPESIGSGQLSSVAVVTLTSDADAELFPGGTLSRVESLPAGRGDPASVIELLSHLSGLPGASFRPAAMVVQRGKGPDPDNPRYEAATDGRFAFRVVALTETGVRLRLSIWTEGAEQTFEADITRYQLLLGRAVLNGQVYVLAAHTSRHRYEDLAQAANALQAEVSRYPNPWTPVSLTIRRRERHGRHERQRHDGHGSPRRRAHVACSIACITSRSRSAPLMVRPSRIRSRAQSTLFPTPHSSTPRITSSRR